MNKYDVAKINMGFAAYEIVKTEVVPPFKRHVLFTLTPMYVKWADRLEFKLHLGKMSVSLRPRINALEKKLNDLKNGHKLIVALDRKSGDPTIFCTDRLDGPDLGIAFEREGEYLKVTMALLGQPLVIHISERDLLWAIMDLQGVLPE